MAPDFSSKEINDQSLGDLLRSMREARRLTFDDVERATRISKKYLSALEQNEFKKLPDPVYSKNFVRALAKFYGLDADEQTESLMHEMAALRQPADANRPGNFIAGRTLTVTPTLIKRVLIGGCFLAIAGYFAFSVHQILKPPKITIYSPQDNSIHVDQKVVLQGKTEPEVELTINKEPVPIEADGSFKDTLTLPPGASFLRVAAKKKHSKENEVYLKVVVQGKPAEVVASATATPKNPS